MSSHHTLVAFALGIGTPATKESEHERVKGWRRHARVVKL